MNAATLWVFDITLAVLAVGLAWASLAARDAARMVALFIAFGAAISLVWVRLRAPDVALAEAAIGSALTGALLLRAHSLMTGHQASPPLPAALRVASAAVSAALAIALAWGWMSLVGGGRPSLERAVADRIGESGVTNPVTAVLLNFRAYDTLLEVAVLLLAVIGIFMLGRATPARSRFPLGPLYMALLRVLTPTLCVLAGYLLWLGSFAPGGAFQAGAVLAGALILLLLAGVLAGRVGSVHADGVDLRLKAGLVAGLGVFIGVAVATAISPAASLQYPVSQAKNLILLIEAALTVSIALTLVILFIGGRPDAALPAESTKP